jgi:hypothetical protein
MPIENTRLSRVFQHFLAATESDTQVASDSLSISPGMRPLNNGRTVALLLDYSKWGRPFQSWGGQEQASRGADKSGIDGLKTVRERHVHVASLREVVERVRRFLRTVLRLAILKGHGPRAAGSR